MKISTFGYRLKCIWQDPWDETKALVRCFFGRHEEGRLGAYLGAISCEHCHKNLWFVEDREIAVWKGVKLKDVTDDELRKALDKTVKHVGDLESLVGLPGFGEYMDTQVDRTRARKFARAVESEIAYREA